MKAGVITFPGSNCDQDMLLVLRKFMQADADLLWYRDTITRSYDVLVVPGGFSYGDYLRAGAIARFAPAMQSLTTHVRKGGLALGICNGFQILCEAGLLPGALIRNNTLKHICRQVPLQINPANPFMQGLDATGSLCIPVSHSDGNFRIDADGLKQLKANNQIVCYYREAINGSVENIAGVSDLAGRVMGMMPHPERAVDPLTGQTDGTAMLKAILSRSNQAQTA